MNISEKSSFLICYFAICLVNQFAMAVVREYHKNKPLGMQTLLDKVTIFFTKMFPTCLTLICLNVCFVELFAPLPRWISVLSTMLDYVCTVAFYMTVQLVTVTRYTLVYHGSLAEGLNEQSVMKTFKIVCLVTTLVLLIMEYLFLSNIDNLGTFQLRRYGYAKPGSSIEVGIPGSVIVTLLFVIAVHLRIELDGFNANDDNVSKIAKLRKWIRQSGTTTDSGISVRVLQIMVAISILAAILLVYILTGGGKNTKVTQMVFLFVLSCVLPTITIFKHNGMEHEAWKMVNSMFSTVNPIYNLTS